MLTIEPSAPRSHPRTTGSRASKRSEDVDLEHVAPVGNGVDRHRELGVVEVDACVVDQDVDAPELSDGAVSHRLHGGGVGDVHRHGHSPMAVSL